MRNCKLYEVGLQNRANSVLLPTEAVDLTLLNRYFIIIYNLMAAPDDLLDLVLLESKILFKNINAVR